ncbi:MAG TPA: hypothetical protein VLE73_06240 [Candidatus Saccharimonadales bacterium]|nr:hypothetical protein [Candidatus Saccharimonadales bacterium]
MARRNSISEEYTGSQEEAARRHRTRLRGGSLVLAGLCLVLAVGCSWFGWQLRAQANQATANRPETIVGQVAKLIDLPKGETPTIATVQDKAKLKDQAFFANAQNGDKLLIYAQAKKAIIYRATDHRVINVGPIAISAPNK